MTHNFFSVKVLNFVTPKNWSNHPKIQRKRSNHRVMCPKDVDRMANSEDPDHTATFRSCLICICTVCPHLYVCVRKLNH